MHLELGVNDCFAVKRWPRPDDWGPLIRQQLDLQIVEHSFDLIEPATDAGRQAEAVAVRRVVGTHGLRIHSTFTGLAAYSANLLLHPDPAARDAAEDWYRRAIAFTAAVGARATGGHVGAFTVSEWLDPAQRQARWRGLQHSLEKLTAAARADGLDCLLVENLAAVREPSTMEMVRELLTNGDETHVPIRLCLDVGHMCVPGTRGPDRDPYAWLRELGRQAYEVQIQQSDAEGDHHWPFTPERNRLGRIDADRVIDALGEAGVAESTLILEVIPAFEQDDGAVLDDMRRSVDYWRDAMTRRDVLTTS
jgi:sugar phosphate isomerase/epimerase